MPTTVTSNEHKRGFTLIELLVVIGIIAVLISILFPVIRRSRQQSQALACKAQLHDIGAAVQMYLNANRGHYPLSPQLPSVNTNGYETVMKLLAPYNGSNVRIWHCPADDETFPKEQTSYFYYADLGINPLSQTFFYKVFKSASAVPVLWDADKYHGGSVPFNWLFADGHVDQFLSSAN